MTSGGMNIEFRVNWWVTHKFHHYKMQCCRAGLPYVKFELTETAPKPV